MKRDVFQAIADPTRRAILVLLAAQTMTPNALATRFQMSRQAVSKHIQVLKECGVVKQQKTGREIYYHYRPNRMKEIDRWLEQFRQHWGGRFHQLDQVLINLKAKENEK